MPSMPSDYLIQIVHKASGRVVEFEPGLKVEKDFVDDIIGRLEAKGVGIARTTKHVEQDVRAAIEEAIFELKVKI